MVESKRYENVKLARFQRAVISAIFDQLKLGRCTSTYHVDCICERIKALTLFLNREVDSRTQGTYPLWHEKRKFSPFSEGCNFANFLSIKLKP